MIEGETEMSGQRRIKDPEAKMEVPQRRYDISHIAMVASAVLVALLAAPPVYWGYLCRSSGTWCEGSYVSPSSDASARQKVARQIAVDADGNSFLGLQVRKGGFWPFPRRLDVVAQFTDGTETTIDTLPSDAQEIEVYKEPSLSFVGITWKAPSIKGARITGYFPRLNMAKRVFDLGSNLKSISFSISLSNLTYIPSQKRIVVDLRSSYTWFTLNDANQFQIADYKTYLDAYGATVAINLSDTLHVTSVHTVENERNYAEAQRDFENCKRDIRQDPNEEGDLFLCWQSQTSDLTLKRQAVSILEWSKDALKIVAEDGCSSSYWTRDPSKKVAFVACGNADMATNSARTQLGVYKRPFNEITYFLKGSCSELTMYDMRSNGPDGIAFQLWTNCNRIMVNDRGFDIALPSDGAPLRAMFELKTDKNGLPVSLSPL